MRLAELATDFYFHLGLVFPDISAPVKDLKRLTSAMDEAGLDYTKSAFAPNDAVFEAGAADSQEKTVFRVTQKFLAITHHFVKDVQFEAFCKRAEMFVPLVARHFSIPTFLNQEYFVRKLVATPDGEDARLYLGGSVLGIEESDLGVFEKPTGGLGLRLYFPAEQAHPVIYDLKIETFLRDGTRIFIENHARYLQPLPSTDAAAAVTGLRRTREFIEEKVFRFLEGSGEGPPGE